MEKWNEGTLVSLVTELNIHKLDWHYAVWEKIQGNFTHKQQKEPASEASFKNKIQHIFSSLQTIDKNRNFFLEV